jgi:hypothetical protein
LVRVGPVPCHGTKIKKSECRFGTWVPFKDHGSFKWRHLACITCVEYCSTLEKEKLIELLLSHSSKKQLENLKKEFSGPEDVDGYDEIP